LPNILERVHHSGVLTVAIAIEIGSPNSSIEKVKTTIDSIMTNIGTSQYKLIIAMAPYIAEEIKDHIYTLKRERSEVIDLMPEENYDWADFINNAIDRSQDYKYFIESHDDIELLTPDFLPEVESILAKLSEPVGWVSFTDKDYLNGHWAPSVRPGYNTDFLFENGYRRRKLFQFHNLPENWWRPPLFTYYAYLVKHTVRSRLRLKPCSLPVRSRDYYANLPYDFPSAPVKCHAPYNHFVLIEMDKLRKIVKGENWGTPLSLLVDEDWGLRALQLGLNNVWIPDIEYVHFRPSGGTRAGKQIAKEQGRLHKLFFEKWGFHLGASAEEIVFIKKKYKNTNIPWSIDRRSYEWDYIK
jgi:hypothetical protein